MALVTRRFSVNFGASNAGLSGSITYQLRSAADAVLVASTGAGVAEFPANSGCYFIDLANFDTTWGGSIIWTLASPATYSVEDFAPGGQTAAYTRRFSANLGTLNTGLAGTLTYNVKDNANVDIVAQTAAGIAEFPAGSGCYWVAVASFDPTKLGSVIWSKAGAAPVAVEDFVSASSAGVGSGGGGGGILFC